MEKYKPHLETEYYMAYIYHTMVGKTKRSYHFRGHSRKTNFKIWNCICGLDIIDDILKVKVTWHVATCGICALHLTHPKCTHSSEHTPWTHTRSSGQPFMLRHPGSSWGFGALLKGTSVVVLRVKESAVHSLPPLQFLADLRLELATFRIRVRLSNH